MRHLKYFVLLVLGICLTGCSGRNQIKITGDTIGGKEMTLRLICYTPDGVRSEVLATRSGHFEYSIQVSKSKIPVFIEVYTNDYKPLGMAMAEGGDNLRLTVDPAGVNGFRFENNDNKIASDYAGRLASWLKSVKNINNTSVGEFVRSNSDSPAAYAVLTMLFDAAADTLHISPELLNGISSDYRPEYYNNGFVTLLGATASGDIQNKYLPVTLLSNADTLMDIDASRHDASIIVFTGAENNYSDSIGTFIHNIVRKVAGRNIMVLEHNLAQDTVTWHRTLRQYVRSINKDARVKAVEDGRKPTDVKELEKIDWTSVWSGPDVSAPGVREYSVTSLPYFVVTDSTGTIIYNGADYIKAEKELFAL